MEDKMICKKSWLDFKKAGMLWFINTILHTFGWAIVYEKDEFKNVVDVYPAKVKFRGFSEEDNMDGYIKVSKYLEENAKELREESESR